MQYSLLVLKVPLNANKPSQTKPDCGCPTAQMLIGGLSHLGSDAGMSLPNANTGCGRVAADVDEHVGQHPSQCTSQSNWPVAKRLDDRVCVQ